VRTLTQEYRHFVTDVNKAVSLIDLFTPLRNDRNAHRLAAGLGPTDFELNL